MTELRPVDNENIDAVLALKVHDHQKRFVDPTAVSLAQAYVYHDDAYPFAVYDGDEIVGFIMMGYYRERGYHTLWELMIDKHHQRKGHARRAIMLGVRFLKERYNVDSVYLFVDADNDNAKKAYLSAGFAFTGVTENGNDEMRIDCM